MTRSFGGNRKRLLALVGSVALVGAMAACGGSEGEGETSGETNNEGTTSIKVLMQPTSWGTQAIIAQEQGFFEDEGLDVELETVANQAAQVPLMVSGQAQFAVGANLASAIAIGQGIPLRIIATSTRNEETEEDANVAIITKGDSDIKTAADLEGKKVAQPAFKGASEYLVRVAMEKADADWNKATLIQLDQAAGVAALDKGEVDAALVFQPYLAQAVAAGKRVVSFPALETAPGKMFTHWYATADFLEKNPGTAEKFIAAITRASEYANENPEAVTAALAKELSMPDDVAALLPRTLYGGPIDEEQVQNYLDTVERFGWNDKELPPAADIIWTAP